ncbi:hypothetical protein [Thermococcus sp.]
MNEYLLVRALVGAVAMTATVFTGLTFFMLSGFSKRWKRILLLQLAGAVLIAAGFSTAEFHVPGEILPSLAVITGAVVMSFPLLRNVPVAPPRTLAIKGALVLTSPAAAYLSGDIGLISVLRAFVLLSLLILMGTLMSVRMKSHHTRLTLNAASWILVAYSWLGEFRYTLSPCGRYVLLLVYYTSLLLWLFGAMTTLLNLRGWLGWRA